MEKCRCIKISQIENMSKLSRCRVWWSRPDKLRQLGSDCPSFEEVDSAVKRLETQRLNLNRLGNGCNMKPMENPWGKTENCMKVHHWTWDCNGIYNGIYNVESCGTNMSLSKNMYCWEDCQQSAGQLALWTSSCGSALWLCAVPKPNRVSSESRSKKTTEKNLWHKWETLCCEFGIFVWRLSSVPLTIVAPSFDPRSGTGIRLPTKWITLKLGDFLSILQWPIMTTFQFLNDLPFSWQFLELQTATSRKEGPTESRPFGSLKYWTNESVSFLRLLAKVLKPKTILKRTARCTMFDPQDTFGRPSEGFTLVRSSELVGPVASAEFDFPIRTLKVSHQKCCPIGHPKHGIAWKKMTWNERSASTATGATLFSQRRATVAGCGDQTANGVLSNSRVWVFACLWRTTL